jgi:hypothetical protein
LLPIRGHIRFLGAGIVFGLSAGALQAQSPAQAQAQSPAQVQIQAQSPAQVQIQAQAQPTLTPGNSQNALSVPPASTTVAALPELSPSASEAEAIFKLANRLEAGDAHLARDDVLARRLYRIAADAGHAGAQCNLGAMLMDGSGGPTDLAGGAALFRKAALRGHGLAQYNLGVMHALGDGVVKDSGEAMAWIEQAITRLPEGEALASAKAWREHLRNRMSPREGMVARSRSQELGEAIVRELTSASSGSASRAARTGLRAGLDELGLSAETLQRLGLSPSAVALNGKTSAEPRALPAANIEARAVGVPKLALETALQQWLGAWSERRIDDYLSFYDAAYKPPGKLEHGLWVKQRRAALRQPQWIKVRAEQLSVTEMAPDEFVVSFEQVYAASTGHRETTKKTMIWRWVDGRWRIASELTAPREAKAATPADVEKGVKAPLVAAASAMSAESAAPQPTPTPALAATAQPATASKPVAAPATPPSAATAQPPATAQPAGAHVVGLEPTVRAWLKAWTDRQVDDYLGYYAPGFEVPGGADRSTWAAARREAITRPAWIKVRADQLRVTEKGAEAEVHFFEVVVVAPGTVELARKTMVWALADGRWQIVQERAEFVERRQAKHK